MTGLIERIYHVFIRVYWSGPVREPNDHCVYFPDVAQVLTGREPHNKQIIPSRDSTICDYL